MNLIKNKNYNRIFLPLAAEQLFMTLVSYVNAYLLSTYNDKAIAAIGMAEQALSIGGMATGIVSLGSTIVFLQNADYKHLKHLQSTTRASLVLNIILSAVLSFAFIFFSDQIINLIRTPAELKLDAAKYLRIISLSLFFLGCNATLNSILRSFGFVKTATAISVITTILIISSNAVVVLTPIINQVGGVHAIAMSTLIMRGVGTLICLVVFCKKLPSVSSELLNFSADDIVAGKQILGLGIPSSMENVSYNFSQTVITAFIATTGTIAITSKMYAQTITSFIFTFAAASAQASQIIIGKYLREKKIEKAKSFGAGHVRFVVLISICMNILIAIFCLPLIKIFTNDMQIIKLTSLLLVLNIFYDPMRCANEVLISDLHVTGDVRFPVFLGVGVAYLFVIPAIFLCVSIFKLGIVSIWIVFIIDEGLRAIVFYRRWFSKLKKESL